MINAQVYREEPTKLHLTEAGDDHAFLVASIPGRVDAELAAGDAYTKIADLLDTRGMTIVHERLFGSLSVEPGVMAARKRALCLRNIPADSPLTYIQGHPPWGEGLAGVIIRAVASTGTTGTTPDGTWSRYWSYILHQL